MVKILVSDPIADKGIEILEKAEFEVIYNPSLSDDELQAFVKDINGWVVRSGTKITSDHLKDARNLQVIGRAGAGVDNIDIEEATSKGIIVMNIPDGNTISAAEHTIAMMLSLSRHIPIANKSTLLGKWERKK